jgi:hypothetical protein
MAKINRLTIASVGNNAEKLECSYTTSEGAKHFVPLKLNM